MKKRILTASILTTLVISTAVYTITVGVEPPAQYINNLKTCTKSTFKQSGAAIDEYTIKGKLPNGRCEVYISSYTNFADPKVYEGFKIMTKSFAQMANDIAKNNSNKITDADIPTQEQMIEQGKKEKYEMICNFSERERKALYEAYQKHDGKNPPAKIENGNVSFSFDSSKMSSYDNLSVEYGNYGPCKDLNEEGAPSKKYFCKYADTTCYVRTKNTYTPSVSCSQKDGSLETYYTYEDPVLKHAKQGLCEQLF